MAYYFGLLLRRTSMVNWHGLELCPTILFYYYALLFCPTITSYYFGLLSWPTILTYYFDLLFLPTLMAYYFVLILWPEYSYVVFFVYILCFQLTYCNISLFGSVSNYQKKAGEKNWSYIWRAATLRFSACYIFGYDFTRASYEMG